MSAGNYNLSIRGFKNHTIKITVHEGKMLNNMENIILKKNCLQEIVSTNKIIKLSESKISLNEVSLKLADFSKNTRVHIVATNFVATNHDSQF